MKVEIQCQSCSKTVLSSWIRRTAKKPKKIFRKTTKKIFFRHIKYRENDLEITPWPKVGVAIFILATRR